MKVVGYIRVSTEEQAMDGVSLDAQEAKIRAYCQLYDLELVGVIVDAGKSAKDLDRPGVQRCLEMLELGEAEGIAVAKLDRLTRSVSDLNTLIEEYFSADAGFALFSVGDSIDTRSAAGRLVLNVLMSVAQWEREIISERTIEALAHKKSKGERVGSIPYGKALGSDGVSLVDDRGEQMLIDRILRLRRAGTSVIGIATILNHDNIPAKNGGKWHKTTVMRILHAETA